MQPEPLGLKIEKLLRKGKTTDEIVAALGCKRGYVFTIKTYGSHADMVRADAKRRRKRLGQLPHDVRSAMRADAAIQRSAAIIADVNNGLSYSEAARKHSLTSRNVVAGIMSRYRERVPA